MPEEYRIQKQAYKNYEVNTYFFISSSSLYFLPGSFKRISMSFIGTKIIHIPLSLSVYGRLCHTTKISDCFLSHSSVKSEVLRVTAKLFDGPALGSFGSLAIPKGCKDSHSYASDVFIHA